MTVFLSECCEVQFRNAIGREINVILWKDKTGLAELQVGMCKQGWNFAMLIFIKEFVAMFNYRVTTVFTCAIRHFVEQYRREYFQCCPGFVFFVIGSVGDL